MDAGAKGLLAVWTDIAPEAESDFNEWYNREHLPERARNAGFLNARRYRALEGAPRYFAAYDTEALASLGAPAYVEALAHQSEWSRRMFPHFRDTARMIAAQVHDRGEGLGGGMLTLRLEPADGEARRLADALGELAARLLERPAMVRVSVALGVIAALGGDAAEAARQAADVPDALALLVEASDVDALRAAAVDPLADDALARLGALRVRQRGLYACQCAVARPPAGGA